MLKKIKQIFIFLLLILLGSGVSYSIYSFTRFYKQNDLFTLKEIIVINNKLVSNEEIIRLSDLKKDTNLQKIDKQLLLKNISRNIYIEDCTFKVEYPGLLKIIVKEISPLAFFVKNGRLCFISNQGKILGEVKSTKIFDLPIIRGVTISDEILLFLKQTKHKNPFIYQCISEIRDYPKGLALTLTGSGAKVIVGNTKIKQKIVVLENFIKETTEKIDYNNLEYIDLRFNQQVVTKDINS